LLGVRVRVFYATFNNVSAISVKHHKPNNLSQHTLDIAYIVKTSLFCYLYLYFDKKDFFMFTKRISLIFMHTVHRNLIEMYVLLLHKPQGLGASGKKL
jgi:presenilin-like A22 family membrane protease